MVILDYNEVRSPERLQAIRAHERQRCRDIQPGLPDIPFISFGGAVFRAGPGGAQPADPDLSSGERQIWRWSAALHGLSAP